jgi:3',5'-cyclic AMP phosphodiesterase CpdA
MPDELRLAHLSDPHPPLALPRGAELLGKRGLGALSARLGRGRWHDPSAEAALLADLAAAAPDRIAMTGDLVSFSLEREFEAARAWLARLGSPERVLALPGNHEALAPGWQARLARGWGDYAALEAPGMAPCLRRAGPVALIAASTAEATAPGLACGRLGRAARDALGALVARARAEGLCPVVLMHHPPTPLTSARKGLRDAPAARAALAEAALVLHGHTHRAELSVLPGRWGPVPVLGAPAFGAGPRAPRGPGGWRLIRLRAAGGRWRARVEPREIRPDGEVRALAPLRLDLHAAGHAGER